MKKKISIILAISIFLIVFILVFHSNIIMALKNVFIHNCINSALCTNLYTKILRNEKKFDADHVITYLDNGMPIIVNKDDRCVCWFIRMTGHWDSNESRVIGQLVKKDFQIIEVGANFGVHTLRMAGLIGEKGKIFAFEANPYVSKNLKKSIEMNNLQKTIILYEKAAGDINGEAFINFGISNIGGGHLVATPNETSIKTRIVRIDDTLEVQKIDLLKIDAEGCEQRILNGAKKILQANPNIILMLEWGPDLLKKQGTETP